MDYDTHIVIGSTGRAEKEHARDLAHPYDDGSGYPSLKDENGRFVYTGRKICYMRVYATMDLCHIYNSHLERVVQRYSIKQKKAKSHTYPFFFCADGNTRITEDNYGEPLIVVPYVYIVRALKKDVAEDDPYHRFQWLLDLLESMKESRKELTCAFYGS